MQVHTRHTNSASWGQASILCWGIGASLYAIGFYSLLPYGVECGKPNRWVELGEWYGQSDAVNQKVGVTNNDKRTNCWCGTGQVSVAAAMPAIQYSPSMGLFQSFQGQHIFLSMNDTQSFTGSLLLRYHKKISSSCCYQLIARTDTEKTLMTRRDFVTCCILMKYVMLRVI